MNYRVGRRRIHSGYILVLMSSHPAANKAGYVREHRLVVEDQWNCCLLPWAEVHHNLAMMDGPSCYESITFMHIFNHWDPDLHEWTILSRFATHLIFAPRHVLRNAITLLPS